MNKGKFAIMSKTTNEAVIIDDYDAYQSVTQDGDCVTVTEQGRDKVYVDCILLNIS